MIVIYVMASYITDQIWIYISGEGWVEPGTTSYIAFLFWSRRLCSEVGYYDNKYQIISSIIMFEDIITFVIYRNGFSRIMIRHDIYCALLYGSLLWNLHTRCQGSFL
jgi:hypothetical protein